jgi:excisionase family DNA binding protein
LVVTQPRPLKPAEVADLFAVSVETVKNWAEDGKLPGFLTPTGRWRFHRADVDRALERQAAS